MKIRISDAVFESGQQRVSRELQHIATKLADNVDQLAKVAVQCGCQFFGPDSAFPRQSFGQAGKARDIRKQNGTRCVFTRRQRNLGLFRGEAFTQAAWCETCQVCQQQAVLQTVTLLIDQIADQPRDLFQHAVGVVGDPFHSARGNCDRKHR
mgnify:CR=1 FL=1